MKSERQRPLLCEVGARPLRDEPRGWDEGAATLREVEPLHLGPGGYRWHLELGEGAIDGAWSLGTGAALGAWPGEWAAGGLTRHWTTTPRKGRVAGCGARRVRRVKRGRVKRVRRRGARWARWARGGRGRWWALWAVGRDRCSGNDRGGGVAAEVGEERGGGVAAEVVRSAAVARPLRWAVRSAGGLGGRRW
jgi:hypothetical protein